MDAPKLGYQGSSLFIMTAMPLGNDIYLCETKEGRTGKGKVTRVSVVRPHPLGDTAWIQFGHVKPSAVSYRKGQWKVTLWGYDDTKAHRYCEAHMPTELLAVEFMVRNATEFFKS